MIRLPAGKQAVGNRVIWEGQPAGLVCAHAYRGRLPGSKVKLSGRGRADVYSNPAVHGLWQPGVERERAPEAAVRSAIFSNNDRVDHKK